MQQTNKLYDTTQQTRSKEEFFPSVQRKPAVLGMRVETMYRCLQFLKRLEATVRALQVEPEVLQKLFDLLDEGYQAAREGE